VNAAPHIGHAYTTIVADVMARFHYINGQETYFLTGTDEHGDKVVEASAKAGETPQVYTDRISRLFRELWPKLNISNNDFIRTTEPRHKKIVQAILQKVKDQGDIYFSEYEGRYCFGCERFYTERELVNGKCPDHLVEPTMIKESNYFFRMSKYQNWLIEYIKKNPDFIRPERYKNEVLSFLKEPLEDLCISRPKTRLTWGIDLPFDDQYVTYVWFDALINYFSALDYPDGALYKKFWPVAQHIIAKDILKPHGIYWPCMLKAAGIEPFQHLNVHGYWNINEGKMSKSLGNVVKPLDMADLYGLDAFRYFLLREMVFGLDAEFSEEALVARINADLANDIGNLASRSLSMAHKFFKGEIPAPGPMRELDESLKKDALELISQYATFMERIAFHKALIAIWEVINKLNKYIDTTAPWVLAKSDPEYLKTVIYVLLEIQKIISVLIWPFMPESAEKLQGFLGLARIGKDLTIKDISEWGHLSPKKIMTRVPHLFPRVEQKTLETADNQKGKANMELEKTKISYQEFAKLDLRVGTVKEAEAVPKSKKLIKMKVDIGEERTVLAGILNHYQPQDLVGKQVIIVANLEPATLMGIESQGMVLAAEDETGIHVLMPDEPTQAGSKVK
jgi:methionyl-tRNA synthetase